MIVPLKILKGHQIKKNIDVISVKFHPTQPWLFTSGADNYSSFY